MANSMTTDQLIAELKKRGCTVDVIKPKPFELLDDCWNIVKEFAGIYNLTTKWDKLEKLGVEKVHDVLKKYSRRRLTNYKKNPLNAKQIIYKILFTKNKSLELMTELKEMIDPKKEKKDTDTSFLDGFKVGDEVEYIPNGGMGWGVYSRLGKIVKINKSSVSWAEYEVSHSESDNPSACYEQTFENKKHYYDKSNLMKSKSIKNFSVPTNPDDFIYYTSRHDWGR
tara:strand:+ start:39 stop:713 length:675 start_codon:yes stop_codon:yes gene_type:complete